MVNQEALSKIGRLLALGAFILGAIPSLVLFVFGGIESPGVFDKFVYYFGIGGLGLIGMLGIALMSKTPFESLILLKNNNINVLEKIPGFRWMNNAFKILLFSIVLFGAIAIFQVATQTAFSAFPSFEQQFSKTGKIVSAGEPAAIAENIYFTFLMSLVLFGLNTLKNKFKWNKTIFLVFVIILLPLANGVGWMTYHTARYGNDDAAKLNTFYFGTIGGFFNVITGSFFPWWIWHNFNNLSLEAREQFSKDSVLIIMGIVWSILLIIMLVYFLIIKEKSVGKSEETTK